MIGTEYHCLTIEKMPEGGFVVIEGMSEVNRHNFRAPLFACSAIGDALDFMRGKLAPEAREPLTADGKSTTIAAMDEAMRYSPAKGGAIGGVSVRDMDGV